MLAAGRISMFYYKSPHLGVFWKWRTPTSFIFIGKTTGFGVPRWETAIFLGKPRVSFSATPQRQASAKVLDASSRATRSKCGSILPDSAVWYLTKPYWKIEMLLGIISQGIDGNSVSISFKTLIESICQWQLGNTEHLGGCRSSIFKCELTSLWHLARAKIVLCRPWLPYVDHGHKVGYGMLGHAAWSLKCIPVICAVACLHIHLDFDVVEPRFPKVEHRQNQ